MVLVVLMVFCLAGAALGETAAEKVTLKVWVPQKQIETGTINSMCDSFQALHPEWDIEYTIEAQGEDTAKDEVLKDVTTAGDVFFFANDQISELVNAGALARLGGATEEMVKSTMSETVVDTAMVDGKLYGIPFTHNTFFMFYDKTLLADDQIGSLESIMAADTAEDVYNFDFDAAGGWKLAAWYYGAGCTVYGADGMTYDAGCDWNSETGMAVTNYLLDLLANPKCAYNDDIALSQLVSEHRVGAWFDGSWNYGLYHDAIGDDLGVAVIPTFNPDGNDYQLKGFYGSKVIGVNTNAPYQQVAVAFAAYLGDEAMQLQRFEETAQVPTNSALAESDAIKSDAVAMVIMKEADTASVMQPTNANFSKLFWSNATSLIADMHNGEITAENAQEKMDAFCALLAVTE